MVLKKKREKPSKNFFPSPSLLLRFFTLKLSVLKKVKVKTCDLFGKKGEVVFFPEIFFIFQLQKNMHVNLSRKVKTWGKKLKKRRYKNIDFFLKLATFLYQKNIWSCYFFPKLMSSPSPSLLLYFFPLVLINHFQLADKRRVEKKFSIVSYSSSTLSKQV